MNNKILIGVVAVIVLLGGALLLGTNVGKKLTNPAQPIPTTQTQVTMSPSPTAQTATGEATKGSVTVTLTSSGFNPSTVTIKAGEKVAWLNKSGETATVNSDVHPTHLLYPPLNLGRFDDGQSLSLVFDKSGSFGYHNHLNPSETGTVVVTQ